MKRSGRLLLLALAALGYAGCTEPGTPVSPAVPSADAALVVGRGGPDLSYLATFRTPPSITIAWAKQWIGPAGGRLEFHGFAIDVPAGAVTRTTQFSIRLPVDPQASEHVVAEFGPHSVEFARPISIELPFAGTSIEETGGAVLWWNPLAHDWVDMGATVTADGERLRANTDHFSLYGTGTVTRSGGVTVSGG
jgi:hypothetical protein